MHLNLEEIIDILEARQDNKHADECTDCRERIEDWRQFHSRLHKSHLTDAPAALLKKANGVMASPRPKLGQAMASIIFDSFSQPAFAGARGAGGSRQVVLRSAEFDVHVRISGKPENLQITGQVLTRAAGSLVNAARVHLLQNGERIQSAELDPLGEFEFVGAPEGLLSLQIDLPNLTVVGPLGNEEVV